MARTRTDLSARPARDEARTPPSGGGGDDGHAYTVVARRYRPQTFEDVVGQDHVVQALRNAIRMNRVTHAYLFSGTRGVGKTSIARIFARCLNCVHGPTDHPCNECDICQAIAAGQDVDVIEIDGASNNGVEQVRELRQNAGLRPSRARFKIYYIDEVHMLSTGAFNALLKTLEEPPDHVKFFFATTEPNKIPITVLSRCQRFDFAGIAPEQIIDSLVAICRTEGIDADRDALQAVARRAGGSMRDAQSLLEQLLSFGGTKLTSELVHQALGIAPDDRVLDLIDALADHDAAKALTLLDRSSATGVQPGELLAGVLDFLRDVMVISAGAEVDSLAAAPSQRGRLRAVAERWPLDAVMASLQILAEARARMRGSPHGRLLVELALCRVARLEDLTDLSDLVDRLTSLETGAPLPPPKKKVTETVADGRTQTPAAVVDRAPEPRADRDISTETRPIPESRPGPSSSSGPGSAMATAPRRSSPTVEPVSPAAGPPVSRALPPLKLEAAVEAWKHLPDKVGLLLGMLVSGLEPKTVEPPDLLVLAVPFRLSDLADRCEAPENRVRLVEAMAEMLGRPVRLRFERGTPDPDEPLADTPARGARTESLLVDPLVQHAVELFDARRVRVDFDDESDPSG